MIKRALMGAAAFLLVACNPGGSPSGSATNTVGGADVVASTQTKMTTATKSLSLDPGKAAQAGQVAIADVITYGGPKVTITAPDGWQLIRDDSTPTTRQSLYWHAIQANDPSPTWSFSTPVDAQGAVVLLSNVAPGAPVDMSNAKTGTGGDLKSASMTTTADGDLILILKATDFSNAPLHWQAAGDMTAVVAQENAPHQYWILAYWQGQNGTTEETEFSFPQLVNWVATQIAIKHGTH
jgi:hypothetical protein